MLSITSQSSLLSYKLVPIVQLAFKCQLKALLFWYDAFRIFNKHDYDGV